MGVGYELNRTFYPNKFARKAFQQQDVRNKIRIHPIIALNLRLRKWKKFLALQLYISLSIRAINAKLETRRFKRKEKNRKILTES